MKIQVLSVALLFFSSNHCLAMKPRKVQSQYQPFSIEQRDLDARLRGAAFNGRTQIVRELLEQGANPDAAAPFGDKALMVAARHCFVEIMELLITYGAALDETNSSGDTALHLAVAHRIWAEGSYDAIKVLIQAGAALSIPNGAGNTPLRLAIGRDDYESAKLLREKGALDKGRFGKGPFTP